MRTLLQLLRIAFWMLPIQRALTVLGAALVLVSLFTDATPNLPGTTLPSMFLGVMLMVIIPLTAGGAFFRMLSSPRSVLLLPRAKPRLLAGMIVVACGSALLWILAYAVAMWHFVPPGKRPGFEFYSMQFVLTVSFATQVSVSLFIASRSPLWALVIIAVWQLPAWLLQLLGFDDAPLLLTGWLGLAMVPVVWTAFGLWYLRTRRIGGIGWSLRGRDSVLTSAPVEAAAPASREQAMERWLLGASTPLRIGAQWLAGVAMLIAIQWLLGRSSPPRAVTAMAFGTLSLCAVVTGAVSYSIAARSRGLWLTGGRPRLALHAWCERLMLRVTFAIVLPFAAFGALLWWLMPPVGVPALYLLAAGLAPALGAAWLGLMQVQRPGLLDAAVLVWIAASWYVGVATVLFDATPHPDPWLVIAPLGAAVFAREVAQARWRRTDWPRARRAAPVS